MIKFNIHLDLRRLIHYPIAILVYEGLKFDKIQRALLRKNPISTA